MYFLFVNSTQQNTCKFFSINVYLWCDEIEVDVVSALY